MVKSGVRDIFNVILEEYKEE